MAGHLLTADGAKTSFNASIWSSCRAIRSYNLSEACYDDRYEPLEGYKSMNVCPVCRNVNSPDTTTCRYCQTALTPPSLEATTAGPARRRWPWLAGIAALVLLVGIGGASLLAGGGAAAQPVAVAIEVGTGEGASLEFEPTSVSAPPNTAVDLTFVNQSTLPHNLTFQNEITAATDENLPAGASETISFVTPDPGTYPFVCTIHPGMDGELIVAEEGS
jgi:plastocyanin